MPDDPDQTLRELRQRIATEGLPKLSAEALRSYKREGWRGPRLVQRTVSKPLLSQSPEALRLFREKADPAGLRIRRQTRSSRSSWQEPSAIPWPG
jgi:hypothetical protein